MKINTALILCAGFGKRLNPITLSTPKPLLEINNVAVLETCIKLIESLGIKKVIITDANIAIRIEKIIIFLSLKRIQKDLFPQVVLSLI